MADICNLCNKPIPEKRKHGQGRRLYCDDCALDVITLHNTRRYRKHNEIGRLAIMRQLRYKKQRQK